MYTKHTNVLHILYALRLIVQLRDYGCRGRGGKLEKRLSLSQQLRLAHLRNWPFFTSCPSALTRAILQPEKQVAIEDEDGK